MMLHYKYIASFLLFYVLYRQMSTVLTYFEAYFFQRLILLNIF